MILADEWQNTGISELNTYVRNIRQSYLSKEAPPRRAIANSTNKQWKYLTDRDREEIDASMKQVLRELNAGILQLAAAESGRREVETNIMVKKYHRLGLGSLGNWAAGGGVRSKSYEQELEESKANTIGTHRENVLFFLRQKLQVVGSMQASMMQKRIDREEERNRNRRVIHDLGRLPTSASVGASSAAHMETLESHLELEDLTPEQKQLFDKEGEDMMKQFDKSMSQVRYVARGGLNLDTANEDYRTAEQSLVEISELHSQLAQSLETQSAHIDQLVADSQYTTENVGGGNKHLKQATERKSTARMVFYASCGLSLFLIVWDLVI